MMRIEFNWKPFPIYLPDFESWLRSMYPTYTGNNTTEQKIILGFSQDVTQEQVDSITSHWDSLTQEGEDAKRQYAAAMNIAKARVGGAMAFSRDLLLEFAAENIVMGLTTDQVRAISMKCAVVVAMLANGAIVTALREFENLIPDATLSQERIVKYANKVRDYLGMPRLSP